jgi:hypothetical protein
VVPRVIAGAGDQAARRFPEFVGATIRNKNTRGGIADIEPLHPAAYIKKLRHAMSKPTSSTWLHMLFDWSCAPSDTTNPTGQRSSRANPRCHWTDR